VIPSAKWELINEREALLIYRPANGIIALLLTLVLISNADAACSVSGGCGGDSGDWESSAKAFLNSDIPGSFIQNDGQNALGVIGVSEGENIKNSGMEMNNSSIERANSGIKYNSFRANDNPALPYIRSNKFVNGYLLKPLLGVSSSDQVIDVSNYDRNSKRRHIEGAIQLPSKDPYLSQKISSSKDLNALLL
jgi:hypothetical protein